jgi:hypothetical protein
VLSNLDSHVAVVTKVNEEWYLLDVTLAEPLNISENPDKARDWLVHFDYLNVFTLEGSKLSLTRSRPLLEKWDRIMQG